MYKYYIILVLLLFRTSPSYAATWYVFDKAYNDKSMYFFDVDTVVKNNGKVTIWTKYVMNTKYPDDDGSYATAEKQEISCAKRTSQTLAASIYDKDGQFIKSFPTPGKIFDLLPDSIGEAILKAACTSDFPKNKSKGLYYPVDGNDIYRYAANYYKKQEAMHTDIAPNTTATWNVFNHAFNERSSYYFDANTVTRNNDTVKLWTKYVKNVKYPDDDGGYARAQNLEISCAKHTAQFINSSIYNKEGQYIKSLIVPSDIFNIADGTILEAIYKAVCTSDFPNSNSRDQYFPVEGNDIYQETENYYKIQEAKKTDLAPN